MRYFRSITPWWSPCVLQTGLCARGRIEPPCWKSVPQYCELLHCEPLQSPRDLQRLGRRQWALWVPLPSWRESHIQHITVGVCGQWILSHIQLDGHQRDIKWISEPEIAYETSLFWLQATICPWLTITSSQSPVFPFSIFSVNDAMAPVPRSLPLPFVSPPEAPCLYHNPWADHDLSSSALWVCRTELHGLLFSKTLLDSWTFTSQSIKHSWKPLHLWILQGFFILQPQILST